MDLTASFDGYCERIDPSYWAEPINAVTNFAFVIAAIIMALRTRGLVGAQILCLILGLIGIGSFLFHTHATLWAMLADIIPIGVFILIYLFLTNRDAVGLTNLQATIATALYIPAAIIIVPILAMIPFIGISSFYWTVPMLLVGYGYYMRHTHRAAARGFMNGAALLSLSIALRSLDELTCDIFPIGTHFTWHLLNSVMLGYMIHVYAAHILARHPSRR